MKILQLGLGGFGKQHLRVWKELGLLEDVYIADLNSEMLKQAEGYGISDESCGTNPDKFASKVDIVDIVTPADTHFALCNKYLAEGKDIFVEKPMTLTVQEAKKLAEKVEKSGRVLQVGYHWRYNDLTKMLKQEINDINFGSLRYLAGDFKGFKRPRTDVGVTHSDAIHFIDLFNYLTGSRPSHAFAVMRNFMPRGSYHDNFMYDDLSVMALEYPNGLLARLEAGYVQPGIYSDPYVPGAMTTKTVTAVGSHKTIEIDYEGKKATAYSAMHHLKDGAWVLVNDGRKILDVPVSDPLVLEFKSFFDCVRLRGRPIADAQESVVTQTIVEAAYKSAKLKQSINISYE
ncbi:MAG TPA: Gfo/Idh/MocA family oxidoreductase [Candidatus Nanoarchaeia archaeon]|nr:Gfo/Idh/MocA family oxidoreductase [Candidatus Nanoarchaeia archaeon]